MAKCLDLVDLLGGGKELEELEDKLGEETILWSWSTSEVQ